MEANLWSDVQKSHQATVKDKVATLKSNNYSELTVVDVTDGWRDHIPNGTYGGVGGRLIK